MISSIVWLYLLYIGFFQAGQAPWKIYIPVVTVELIVYLLYLPKIADFIDRVFDIRSERE